jgi:carbamoyl-phosphate synthase small subunit
LEDGTVFKGEIFGKPVSSEGEVVFNTGMVGYVESLTDPSYRGQILAMTYPLIGNYGVPSPANNAGRFESDRIQVRGLVVSEYVKEYSHWHAVMSLGQWLEDEGIVGLAGIDTRQLTKILREKGTMLGRIIVGDEKPSKFTVADPNRSNLVGEVSSSNVIDSRLKKSGKPHVLVIDCGSKRSIVQELSRRGCSVTVVPYNHDFSKMDCDGILLSNGPGDPTMCSDTIQCLSRILRKERSLPVAGICLGSQIMALAAGGRTFKLKYGHRSQNQPCKEEGTGRCVITSQNHGYAVDPQSLPGDWEVWFKNLNDGTVEGIRHKTHPFFSVQFHPEASPGPTDSLGFFDKFLEVLHDRRQA